MKPILTHAEDLTSQIANCRQKIAVYQDAIKMLSGYTPENCSIRFSINGKQVLEFNIDSEEGDVCMSFFMYWHQFYRRRLDSLTALLNKQL